MKTQIEAVKNHLKRTKSITSLQAINLYGATRLAAIVSKLKGKYHGSMKIKTVMTKVKTRWGNTNVAVYSLKK